MDTSPTAESFRGLLLRHRGRTGLIQRVIAARAGVSPRSVQDWEAGVTLPTAERLQALIRVLLEADGLTAGREALEARELWAAAEREAPRMRTPFDEVWFAGLLASRGALNAKVRSDAPGSVATAQPGSGAFEHAQDWGEAPDVLGFVGRYDELALLRRWVQEERCRVVALLGMGGIGKTSLAARLGQDVAPDFERVYWRSLRDAPLVGDWLAGAIAFVSDQQVVPPSNESERVTRLLQLLRDRRCLLVLDNSETLFEPGERAPRYRAGMAGYGHLLQTLGETSHQSCLVLTGREAPPELAVLVGGPVRTFHIGGFSVEDAQVLLAAKQLEGTGQRWAELNARLGGNGLALKIGGETIREVFGGDIGMFLEEAGESSVFRGIRRLLTEQVQRCSVVEQQVLDVLAVEREPLSLAALTATLGPRVARGAAVEALEALRRRSLVERVEVAGPAAFTLQSVVLEYVTERLVEVVADEIERGEPVLLIEQPLIKASAKDYVRQTQERLIGGPLVQHLKARHGQDGTEQRLLRLLNTWRRWPAAQQGYGPGNLVNLLRLLRGDLRGLDFSRLALRHAYLAQVDAQDAKLVDADLAETVLAEAFDFAGAVALSEDGALLAAGTSTGQVLLWRVADRTPLWAVEGHTGGVWGVALSADGRLAASGGGEGTVRLWEIGTGRPVATLQGHTGTVWGVALSADGALVASGGFDGTVRLWEAPTGRPVATLQCHTGGVRGVALSADGALVASGGFDGTVRLWESRTARPLATLQGQTGSVRGVGLSADGRLVACAGAEGTVALWETSTAQPVTTLHGHTGGVWGVALSPDGQLVASGGEDGTVRLWEVSTGRPVATLQGHTGTVWGVALSADGALVASGGGEGTVRLWEIGTGRPVATLHGHTGTVWGVALSGDGRLVASGGGEGTVRLWETRTGWPVATLQGHTGTVYSVALSGDGRLAASGGGDGTVRLWSLTGLDQRDVMPGIQEEAALAESGVVEPRAERAQPSESSPAAPPSGWQPAATLQGHTGTVYSVALSGDGRLAASGGGDGTVLLWETRTGRQVSTLQGHTRTVWSVALSADGRLLASGSTDGTVRLWEVTTGRQVATLPGRSGVAFSVALCAEGRLLAIGDFDGTVRLWEVSTSRPIATLDGHTGTVRGVALSADGVLLASGGLEGTVRLWSLTGPAKVRGTLGTQEETGTVRLMTTLQGHTGAVWDAALSADGGLVASGGFDGTVRLWEASTGASLHILRPERRYERADITGLTGITAAQRAALLALGAVERERILDEGLAQA